MVFGKLQIKTAKTFIAPKLCLYTFHIMNQVWMKWFIPLHGHFKWCLFYILMSQYIYIIFPSSFRQRVINIHQTEGRPVIVHCSDGWDRTPQVFVWQKRQYLLIENIHFLNCLKLEFLNVSFQLVSLAQLLLDPYYRWSIETLQILLQNDTLWSCKKVSVFVCSQLSPL